MADKKSEKLKAEEEGGSSRLAEKVLEKADKIKYFVIAALVILIVAITVFSYLRREKAARETAAANAVYQAEVDLAADPSKGVEVFGKLAKDYAGLPAGAKAQIITFAHAFNSRQFADAEAAAAEYLKNYPAGKFAARAKLALGQSQFMAGKTAAAIKTFRELAASRDPEVLPEAKLALAQALERDAESAKDQPEEYRRRLELAAEEYSDIVSQAQAPVQRGFWPQAVTLPADFALVIIRDKLAGYEHKPPRGRQESVAGSVPSTIDITKLPPPPADPIEAVRNEAESAAVEEAMKSVAGAMDALSTPPAAEPVPPVADAPDGEITQEPRKDEPAAPPSE